MFIFFQISARKKNNINYIVIKSTTNIAFEFKICYMRQAMAYLI